MEITINQTQNTKLVAQVQNAINTWQQQKPETRTVAHLSRETGVTDSALRRLLNSNTKIADDSIYKLLSHMAGSKRYDDIVAHFSDSKEIGNWMSQRFGFMKGVKEVVLSPRSSNLESIAQSPNTFLVYVTVCVHESISIHDLRLEFGLLADIEVTRLAGMGLVSVKEDIVSVENNIVTAHAESLLSREVIRMALPYTASRYMKDPSNLNFSSIGYFNVSETGYSMILKCLADCMHQISTITAKNPGEKSITFGIFADTLSIAPDSKGTMS